MSWESTELYYRLINEGIKARLGGLRSAKLVLVSVDFQEIVNLKHADDWHGAGEVLAAAARQLEAAGANGLVLCTNTMHKVAPQLASAVNIPLLHLADATAERVRAQVFGRVGLLGTAFTMEQDFYRERLAAFGLEVIVPPAADRATVHRIIYDELCLGEVKDSSRKAYLDVISSLQAQGADAVIAGCTEITLLVKQHDTPVPLFDTTAIHAAAAVDWALAS